MLVLPPLRWTPSPNFSSRGGAHVRLIVAHDCEGSYLGSVSWFAQTRSSVSAHLVLREDGGEATQMVAWGNKAWHACAFNSDSEGIEMAGIAAKGFGAPEWAAAAAIVAWRLKENGLPCRWAEHGVGLGYCSHHDLGTAGGGHDDPTTDPKVWAMFMGLVEAAYTQPMPDAWPIAGCSTPPAVPPGFTPSGGNRSDEPVGSISWAQARLNAIGAARPALAVDGLEGERTARAIVAFQAMHGLYQDGILGPQTVKALAA